MRCLVLCLYLHGSATVECIVCILCGQEAELELCKSKDSGFYQNNISFCHLEEREDSCTEKCEVVCVVLKIIQKFIQYIL